MPEAHSRHVKYSYQDHDTDTVNQAPPILNTWYTLFDDEDVRLLIHEVKQSNDELAAKTIEVRWTIDGNVYFTSASLDNNTEYYVWRTFFASAGGTAGLVISTTYYNACRYTCKRGQSFKVEVRITSALGTNQILISRAIRETLEET